MWVWVRRRWPGWRDHLLIVKPPTVIRWHRKGWSRYWTWKSRTAPGRPRLSAEVRELIGAMSGDNRLWGTERIRGQLLTLWIVVSKRSIRRYRWCKPTPGGSQTSRTFLSNQLRRIWAADLLVVHTTNYRVLHVLFFISHDRRELIHFNVSPRYVYQLIGSTRQKAGLGQRIHPPLSHACLIEISTRRVFFAGPLRAGQPLAPAPPPAAASAAVTMA